MPLGSGGGLLEFCLIWPSPFLSIAIIPEIPEAHWPIHAWQEAGQMFSPTLLVEGEFDLLIRGVVLPHVKA